MTIAQVLEVSGQVPAINFKLTIKLWTIVANRGIRKTAQGNKVKLLGEFRSFGGWEIDQIVRGIQNAEEATLWKTKKKKAVYLLEHQQIKL